MTAPARITQADMDRATKAVANAGIARARIIMDLKRATIEVVIGESVDTKPSGDEEWADEDV